MVSTDLSFNIIQTLYSLFIHNYIVFMYFIGLIISIILNYKHPSRHGLLLIIGFSLLAFSYEYDKHIVNSLREQTLNSLITIKAHYTLEKWINIALGVLLPILLYISGWFFVFLSIIKQSLNSTSSLKHKSSLLSSFRQSIFRHFRFLKPNL